MIKSFTLSIFFSFGILLHFLNAQIEHVEPPNWWIGMKNQNLQILVHGSEVGKSMPSIRYPGVTIVKVHKGDSNNYLFIDLRIDKHTMPGQVVINFQKSGKTIYSYNYSLFKRDQNPLEFKGFDGTDAIYLITPDRFANGDEKNDVIVGMRESNINRNFEGARHGGDIRGIIDHLEYIKDMGFTAIWPQPMLENDMPVYSYHGYSITNHYKVDPRFGTLEEYKELADKAKKLGIKLVFDGVINHIGRNYWWMNDLPFKNWINKTDSLVLTNHRRTVNQDIYASDYDTDLMKNGWFDKTMPDMNGQNSFTATYLIQNSIWWVETLKLGGLRQDTYCYSDKKFSRNWSCKIMEEYPNFNIVGEEWSTNPLITSYWQKDKKNMDGYKSCLHTIMDFPLQDALIKALTHKEVNKWDDGMVKLYEALSNDFVYAHPNDLLTFCDNHDMDRMFMQLGQDIKLTKMALAYLLTMRGIPQIYYGTEILMDNTGHHKNDGLIRSDFPGGWKGDRSNAFSGEGLTLDQIDMQKYLKQLLNFRKNSSVISKGKLIHFAPFNGIYVYFRYTNKELLMVVMNKNEKDVLVETNRFSEILDKKRVAKNVISSVSMDLKDPILIPGKTAQVFEIK
ncbi:MAG: glycoside hydrolase family 13 protein [Saprospiraceae bacterium]|nr:glycoside hydrolase family 13 protein [Saprospiraceae bacterium]